MKSLPFSCLCAACCNHTSNVTSSTAGAKGNLPCLSVKLSLEPELLWRALLQLWGYGLLLCPILLLPQLWDSALCTGTCWALLPRVTFSRGGGTGSWDSFALNPCAKACQGSVVWWEEDLGGSMTLPWALTSPPAGENQIVFIGMLPENFEPLFFSNPSLWLIPIKKKTNKRCKFNISKPNWYPVFYP